MPGPFDHPQRAAFAAHSWLIPRLLSRFKDPLVARQGHTGWTTRSAGRVRNGRFLAQGRRSASSLRTPRGLTTPARIGLIPLCGNVNAAGIRMPLHRFAGTIRRNKHRDDRAHGRLQNPLAQNDVRAGEPSRRWEARWNKWKGQPAMERMWSSTRWKPSVIVLSLYASGRSPAGSASLNGNSGERSRLSSAVWIIVVVFADEGGGRKRCWARSVSIAGVGTGMGPRGVVTLTAIWPACGRRRRRLCNGRHLPPLSHRVAAELAECSAGDQMALDVEEVVDGRMDGEEPLRGRGRFEPRHLSLSSSHRLM